MRILFTVTIFLSSALLFLVQPMAARIILPAFGGTASVWTTAELFFQAVLLLGYGYAHLANRRLGPRKVSRLHLPLMLVAAVTLPFATQVTSGAIGEGSPVVRLLAQLAVMVGLAFFAISAGAPMIQAWFADTRDPHAHDPYFLYSASNLGSMVALLAYPLFFEPHFTLGEQARIWAIGFGVLIALMATCAVVLMRAPKPVATTAAAQAEPDKEAATVDAPITARQRGGWIALSAIPSSLLLGVTAYVTTNITPIPLLWVVPLAIYLLTFILAFAKRPLVGSRPLGRLTPLLVTPLMLAIVMEAFVPFLVVGHLVTFFVAAWMCHSKLSESRPKAAHLTEFYFWISVGGVLGGAFNALLAPTVFNTLFEYPLALIAACFVLPPYRPGTRVNGWDRIYPVLVAAGTAAIYFGTQAAHMPPSNLRTGITVGIPAILCFLAVDRPFRYGFSLLGMLLVANGLGVASDGTVVHSERSFFGVHRVMFRGEGGRFHELTHGNTVHGIQDWKHPETPLTYYHPTGPIGEVFKKYTGPNLKRDVALVGLGVGSLAAYGQPGQNLTYYEIDPVVRKLAEDPRYFTFLRDSKANVKIVMGDARLKLAEAPDRSFDLIVLDAFSSDAIPVHLLTKEAAEMYLRKLKPGGFLAYHISNRYLSLDQVIGALARDLKLVSYGGLDGATEPEKAAGKKDSSWAILARDKKDLEPLKRSLTWSQAGDFAIDRAWTDDFSNVLSVLHLDEQ